MKFIVLFYRPFCLVFVIEKYMGKTHKFYNHKKHIYAQAQNYKSRSNYSLPFLYTSIAKKWKKNVF